MILPAASAAPGRPEVIPLSGSGVWSRPLAERMAVNQLTTLRSSFSHDVELYKQFSVPAIGLSCRKLMEYGVRRSLARLREAEMPVSSLGWIGGFTGDHSTPVNDLLAEARKTIRIAGQVRAGVVTVVVGSQGGHIRSNAERIASDALRVLTPFAATYGVTLAVQPMHPIFRKKWSFLNSLDEALALIDRVGDPRLKLSFGAYHLWPEAGLLARVAALAPQVALVTLADWDNAPRDENDRLLPGQGRLPLAEIVQTFEQQGFRGWYELEVWSRDLWKLESSDLMRRCLASQQALLDQIGVA